MSNNYILGAVGPSGGPQLCNDSVSPFYSALHPDICSTKSATCCHTPLFAFPSIAGFTGSLLLAPLDAPGFYEIYNSNISSEVVGCNFISSTGSNVSYRDLVSGDVTNSSGFITNYNFFVNYGATITLDFSIKIPYTQYDFKNCYNLGRLEVVDVNPDNRGILIGDHWYNNYPGGTGSPFITSYNCSNNTDITPISYPYESPYPTLYWADINSFFYAGDIESYFCSEANYCCDCYEEYDEKICTGSCVDNNFECNCSGVGLDDNTESACFSDIPYVTLQGSYVYTCDVPCGAEIRLIIYRFASGAYDFLPGEEAYFSLTGTTENCL
jgi:hypothetical protein